PPGAWRRPTRATWTSALSTRASVNAIPMAPAPTTTQSAAIAPTTTSVLGCGGPVKSRAQCARAGPAWVREAGTAPGRTPGRERGPAPVWCRAPPPDVVRTSRRTAPAEGVLPVPVPVTDEDLVVGAAEVHREVGRAAAQGVLHEVLRTAPYREGVAAVAVPVTGEDVVTGAAVGEDRVGIAAAQGVLHVVGRPAAHREGVAAVTVPVTDQDVVTGAAVLDDVVGVATTQGVLHVVGRPTAHGQRVD